MKSRQSSERKESTQKHNRCRSSARLKISQACSNVMNTQPGIRSAGLIEERDKLEPEEDGTSLSPSPIRFFASTGVGMGKQLLSSSSSSSPSCMVRDGSAPQLQGKARAQAVQGSDEVQ